MARKRKTLSIPNSKFDVYELVSYQGRPAKVVVRFFDPEHNEWRYKLAGSERLFYQGELDFWQEAQTA